MDTPALAVLDEMGEVVVVACGVGETLPEEGC